MWKNEFRRGWRETARRELIFTLYLLLFLAVAGYLLRALTGRVPHIADPPSGYLVGALLGATGLAWVAATVARRLLSGQDPENPPKQLAAEASNGRPSPERVEGRTPGTAKRRLRPR